MAKQETITIKPLSFGEIAVTIEGTAPLMQNKFSEKAKQEMIKTQGEGETAKKGKKREPKNFDECFRNAQHISEEGWHGVPASAFRDACISACKIVGYQMTRAKLSIFIKADGLDNTEGTPLVRLIADPPERCDMAVRIQMTTDIRSRPMWRKWRANLRIVFDKDQFTASDVVNLINRAGCQVGIGEGRPDSRTSCGLGFGTFRVLEQG